MSRRQELGDKTVLVVQGDDDARSQVGEILAQNGYRCVAFANSTAALSHLAEAGNPDLILSDLELPGESGVDLLRTVKAAAPELPYVLVSGLYDLASALEVLRVGATEILLKPALPDDILRVLDRNLNREDASHQDAVRGALERYLSDRSLTCGDSASQLLPLFNVLGFKRFETLQHSQRVAHFSLLIGTRMGLDERGLEALEIGSLLHDIGKVAIPHNVLMKPGKLTDDEWRIMRLHPSLGRELLADFSGLEQEAQIVYSHHERFDGNGYPRRLARERIPMGARIFAVVDTLDAITSHRCYRAGRSIGVARLEIDRMSGAQFDPVVVDCLDTIADTDLEHIRNRFPDEAA